MTLNSFTSVSLDPMLILVSLAHGTRTLETVTASERFAVNILHRRQRDTALAFAKRGSEFPLDHAVKDPHGYWVVPHSLAILRCHVERWSWPATTTSSSARWSTTQDPAASP